jgi:hypothetical protein
MLPEANWPWERWYSDSGGFFYSLRARRTFPSTDERLFPFFQLFSLFQIDHFSDIAAVVESASPLESIPAIFRRR